MKRHEKYRDTGKARYALKHIRSENHGLNDAEYIQAARLVYVYVQIDLTYLAQLNQIGLYFFAGMVFMPYLSVLMLISFPCLFMNTHCLKQ